MKIKVVANELIDADISMVSLVKHGANRCPFTILKADGSGPTIGERLSGMFHLEPAPRIVAFFIRKGAEDRVIPILARHGYRTEASERDGVLMVPQVENAEDLAQSLLYLSPALGVALDRPLVKVGYPDAGHAILPGPSEAERIMQLEKAAAAKADRPVVEAVEKYVAYARALTDAMPRALADMERDVLQAFPEGLTVAMTEHEGVTMGKDVEKGGEPENPAAADAAAPPAAAEPEVKIGKRLMKKGDEIVEAEYRYLEKDGQEVFLDWVAKQGDGDEPGKRVSEQDEANKRCPKHGVALVDGKCPKCEEEATEKSDAPASPGAPDERLDALIRAVDGLTAAVSKQSGRLDQIEDAAKEAVLKAERPAVLRDIGNFDESFATPGMAGSRSIRKRAHDGDPWKGILSEFDRR